jgi:hypothetical protein
MANLYVLSPFPVSTLSELHLLKKQNGSPATGELKLPDAILYENGRELGSSLLHWISNDEIADFIVYQIIQTHKVWYGRTDY